MFQNAHSLAKKSPDPIPSQTVNTPFFQHHSRPTVPLPVTRWIRSSIFREITVQLSPHLTDSTSLLQQVRKERPPKFKSKRQVLGSTRRSGKFHPHLLAYCITLRFSLLATDVGEHSVTSRLLDYLAGRGLGSDLGSHHEIWTWTSAGWNGAMF